MISKNVYDMVQSDVVKEELQVVKTCACCSIRRSVFILVQKSGIATVLEHVCWVCLNELCVLLDKDLDCSYAYLMKNEIK